MEVGDAVEGGLPLAGGGGEVCHVGWGECVFGDGGSVGFGSC